MKTKEEECYNPKCDERGYCNCKSLNPPTKEEKIKRGCGKEISHNLKNEIITCGKSLSYYGKLPNGREAHFLFKLCSKCQAELKGFQEGKAIAEQKYNELRVDRDKWMIKFAKQKEEFEKMRKEYEEDIIKSDKKDFEINKLKKAKQQTLKGYVKIKDVLKLVKKYGDNVNYEHNGFVYKMKDIIWFKDMEQKLKELGEKE